MRSTIFLLTIQLALYNHAVAQGVDSDAEQDSRWFQIEFIVYRNLAANVQTEEHWPQIMQLTMPDVSYRLPDTHDEDGSLQEWQPPELPLLVDNAADFDTTESGTDNIRPVDGEILVTDREDIAATLSDTATPTENPWLQVRRVPASERELGNILKRLRARSDLDVLEYRSWRQALQADADPVYLRIEAGPLSNGYYALEGYMGFSLRRYLHVNTELWWAEYPLRAAAEPSNGEATADLLITGDGTLQVQEEEQDPRIADTPLTQDASRAVLRAAHLKEQRRMRSDEVHYFDHPLIGALVRISPWQSPEQTENGLASDEN